MLKTCKSIKILRADLFAVTILFHTYCVQERIKISR
jgi:hypothetical protein